jgi:hypothetical protein
MRDVHTKRNQQRGGSKGNVTKHLEEENESLGYPMQIEGGTHESTSHPGLGENR